MLTRVVGIGIRRFLGRSAVMSTSVKVMHSHAAASGAVFHGERLSLLPRSHRDQFSRVQVCQSLLANKGAYAKQVGLYAQQVVTVLIPLGIALLKSGECRGHEW